MDKNHISLHDSLDFNESLLPNVIKRNLLESLNGILLILHTRPKSHKEEWKDYLTIKL